ncbi:NAD(P)/FAD-dependent oxidoreductase [Aquipuribacter sp. SD81]|uniref:NAD(P)/FAD-dependent oxidoreductase n=1 Tax=Aquipuribacter sp. SD81 TaxID=3127703 RepID=UPI003019FFB8
MSGHDADVVVVGGGPVGLASAVGAAAAGLTVAVVEPRDGPVDKACGEGLMPGAVDRLNRLGVDLAAAGGGHPFRGIRYLAPGHAVTADFRAGPGLGVRRTVLSHALAERARELGVRVVRARAGTPVQDPAGVTVAGVRARWCLAADGLHSPVRRALGLARPSAPGAPARFGLRRHVRTAPWSPWVDVLWAEDVEAYVTPVAPDLVGVAVLSSRRRSFDAHLQRLPQLAARLASAEPASPVLGAGPLRQRVRRRRQGRVLLVGDAAGYVDALTGEGLRVGLAAAEEAVACVLADDARDYERRLARVERRPRVLTEGLLAVTSVPLARRALVPAAQRLPGVFSAAVDALAR